MQQELTATFQQARETTDSHVPASSAQHGFRPSAPGTRHDDSPDVSHIASPGQSAADSANAGGADGQSDEELHSLNLTDAAGLDRPSVAGQRIVDYENARAHYSPKQALGFKVVKRPASASEGVQLTDFPNEILTHVLSHLHPDSHGAVALVSKRFYALVTTPHAWRMAFARYFPGQDALPAAPAKAAQADSKKSAADEVRSEHRYFSRLTALASWRSEYLLRTRLLRNIARGKPGAGAVGQGGASRAAHGSKKASAVLTYNSKLPWLVSHVHASFSNGKKAPRLIHGAAELGVASLSDPTIGKVEKWGLDDPFSSAQLDEMVPNLEPYGLDDDGPAAVPNVVDVSQMYGMIAGEGFPGGRVYFRATSEIRGRYLGHDNAIIDMTPEIPKIPELSEAICSVWIAKSSLVPSATQSMVGIMTGSSLGVVSTYALGYDSSGSRYTNGEITARWVLSPGVPIIAIRVDDNFNQRRKTLNRVWAVALNALGEVFYLKDTPVPATNNWTKKGEDSQRNAWLAGRTVYWELIEATRRQARPDELDKNVLRGAYSPRSPCDAMNLSPEQIVAEAKEIEKFMRHKPVYFRKVCDGWDMRRRLEVDFCGGAADGGGESILVIECGREKDTAPALRRFTRHFAVERSGENPEVPLAGLPPSIFGLTESSGARETASPASVPALSPAPKTPETGSPRVRPTLMEEWRASHLSLPGHANAEITASAIDMTVYSVLCHFEDPLHLGRQQGIPHPSGTPTAQHATGEIPGRRSRHVAVGTKTGTVIVWNIREPVSTARPAVEPIRIIQTESPEISCLAVSALYLVHGGSDGLVQAWDPLASSLEPIRTLNARPSGRVPRHIANANPALRHADYSAVGAIFLDPDPTALRGVLSYGTFIRYWAYSSTGHPTGRKRRLRHSDVLGRLASRRQGGVVSSYIAAETAELRREQEHRKREDARLRSRFGVGLGDLTEEEALRYAEMISSETFLEDELRRQSASGDDVGGDTASSAGASFSSSSLDTITPEPSLSGLSSPPGPAAVAATAEETDDEQFEAQIQRALRLSLMEGVNDAGQSPRGNSSGEYDVSFRVKDRKKSGRRSASTSPPASQAHTPLVAQQQQRGGESSSGGLAVAAALSSSSLSSPGPAAAYSADAEDDDLELAIRLSLAEEEMRRGTSPTQAQAVGLGIDLDQEEFPSLEVKGKGKGRSGRV